MDLDYQKDVVRRTMEGAHPFPGVQLQLLLNRLEACPEALPHVAGAIRDMGEWYEQHANELEAEVNRRKANSTHK